MKILARIFAASALTLAISAPAFAQNYESQQSDHPMHARAQAQHLNRDVSGNRVRSQSETDPNAYMPFDPDYRFRDLGAGSQS